jgi:hypothetical protein
LAAASAPTYGAASAGGPGYRPAPRVEGLARFIMYSGKPLPLNPGVL